MSDYWTKYWLDHPDEYRKMVRQFNRTLIGLLLIAVVLLVVTIVLFMEAT